MPHEQHPCPVQRVTHGPFHHFFGYYEKTPWDQHNRYILAHRVGFHTRKPSPDDIADIGIIDLHNDHAWIPLAETTVWNLQQGSMLQWLGSDFDRQIIFNARSKSDFMATIVDVKILEQRHLPHPVYALSRDGCFAITLNFSRFSWTRPVCGYAGARDPWEGVNAPTDDGIYYLDLATGEKKLIISLARIAEHESEPSMMHATHWFNHLSLNPSGTRITFLHRWKKRNKPRWSTRWYTAGTDGSGLYLLSHEGMISHFDWQDDEHLLAWMRYREEDHYYLCSDKSEDKVPVGADVLLRDGHCTFSPDGRWIVTDEYPSGATSERTLILYHMASNTRFDIGRFFSSPQITGDIRCDLHPRWSRDGTKVCIDSIHEGGRQMYLVDVTEVMSAKQLG